jgi:hypothetical protein
MERRRYVAALEVSEWVEDKKVEDKKVELGGQRLKGPVLGFQCHEVCALARVFFSPG